MKEHVIKVHSIILRSRAKNVVHKYGSQTTRGRCLLYCYFSYWFDRNKFVLQDCIMIPIYCKCDILEYYIQKYAYRAYKYEPHKYKYEPQCLLVYKAMSTQVRGSNLAKLAAANSWSFEAPCDTDTQRVTTLLSAQCWHEIRGSTNSVGISWTTRH